MFEHLYFPLYIKLSRYRKWVKINWWNNKENFEHISNFLSSLPLRKAKGLFAFYRGMLNSQSKIIKKLSEKEKLLYELT
jgi:hypothetical protein